MKHLLKAQEKLNEATVSIIALGAVVNDMIKNNLSAEDLLIYDNEQISALERNTKNVEKTLQAFTAALEEVGKTFEEYYHELTRQNLC